MILADRLHDGKPQSVALDLLGGTIETVEQQAFVLHPGQYHGTSVDTYRLAGQVDFDAVAPERIP